MYIAKSLSTLLVLAAATSSYGTPLSRSATNTSAAEAARRLDGKLPSIVPSDFHFSGNVRTYYIQAEQVTWNYAPTGWDNWLGVPLNASTRAYKAGYTPSSGSLGTTYQKALYRGYTSSSFSERTPQPSWQGINGPTLRAEVGDMLQILFCNKLENNYARGEETSYPKGDALGPGECYVYKWLVNEGSKPYEGTDSQMWAYHSFVNMGVDLNSGLAGPTIVYNRGTMNKTMASHREFALLYEVFDESNSFLASTNVAMYNSSANTSAMSMPAMLETNYAGNMSYWKPQLTNTPTVSLTATQAPMFYTLNGWVLTNNPSFNMCTDDRVIWYVYGFGADSHVFHMHGNSFNFHGSNMPSKILNDGNMMTLQMNATATGVWQVLCHVSDHLKAGMDGLYQVYPRGECPLEELVRY